MANGTDVLDQAIAKALGTGAQPQVTPVSQTVSQPVAQPASSGDVIDAAIARARGSSPTPSNATPPGATPGANQITGIGPAPKRQTTDPQSLGEYFGGSVRDYITEAENLTPEGAKAHPIQNIIGKTAGFLVGGSQGIGTKGEGILTDPITGTLISGPLSKGVGAAEAAGAASTKLFGSVEKAGQLFNEVAGAAKDHPIQLSDEVYDALKNIKQLSDAGAKGTPRVAAKLANRLNNVDEELYWDEARRFYSNISRLSANEYQSMNPQMQRAVGQLGRALGDVLNETAAGVGKADQYAQAMQLYRTSKAWQQFGSNAWTFVKKAAPYAVGAGAGARMGMSSLASLFDK
jgi:hypothetical protein